MFEKLTQMAEQAAISMSRRQFLGRFSRGACGVAAAVGGMLALPHLAEAKPRRCGPNSQTSCIGKVEGQWCPAGTKSGTCVGAPICTCKVNGGGGHGP
jgi:hypothetical protein